jgi:hypothetical protein
MFFSWRIRGIITIINKSMHFYSLSLHLFSFFLFVVWFKNDIRLCFLQQHLRFSHEYLCTKLEEIMQQINSMRFLHTLYSHNSFQQNSCSRNTIPYSIFLFCYVSLIVFRFFTDEFNSHLKKHKISYANFALDWMSGFLIDELKKVSLIVQIWDRMLSFFGKMIHF